MAYCTNAEVAAEYNVTFGSGTKYTTAVIDSWIAQADALIDSKLSGQYVVPITGATSLLLMKMISLKLVGHRFKGNNQVKTGEDATSQGGGYVKTLEDQAMSILKAIQEGTTDLPDATRISSAGVNSFNASNQVEQQFHKGVDEW